MNNSVLIRRKYLFNFQQQQKNVTLYIFFRYTHNLKNRNKLLAFYVLINFPLKSMLIFN